MLVWTGLHTFSNKLIWFVLLNANVFHSEFVFREMALNFKPHTNNTYV
jgi:hypothetical protein